MERHQAGQRETLMEVKVEMDSLEVIHQPRGSPAHRRDCFRCVVALAAVTALVIAALAAGFVLNLFMFTPSCNQDVQKPGAKIRITYNLTRTDEQGRYDIFTVDKAGNYLIYGWVLFPEATSKEFTLLQMLNKGKRSIQTTNGNGTEIFFFSRVTLADGVTICIYLNSTYTDSLFHVYEL